MSRIVAAFVLALWLPAATSFAWEIRTEVPGTVDAGSTIELNLWEWLASGNCYVCDGYSVQYGEHAAEIVLTVTRVSPWGDACSGPGDICDYTIPVSFDQPGALTLTITERVVAPPFGGDSQVGRFEIEVQESVDTAEASWGVLKATYR